MPEKLYENLQQWKETRWLKGKETELDLLKPERFIF